MAASYFCLVLEFFAGAIFSMTFEHLVVRLVVHFLDLGRKKKIRVSKFMLPLNRHRFGPSVPNLRARTNLIGNSEVVIL